MAFSIFFSHSFHFTVDASFVAPSHCLLFSIEFTLNRVGPKSKRQSTHKASLRLDLKMEFYLHETQEKILFMIKN